MIEKKLRDYIDINPATKLEKGKCYPFVEMENIVVGIKRPITEKVLIFDGQSCSKFKPNDTLMARITPCLENGKIAKYFNGNAGFGSTEFIVFRGKSGLADDDYVYYIVKSQYIRDMAISSMTGASGRQRADAKFIGKIKWNFPSLNMQTKIASILSAYDELIENNNKRIKLLEQMAENLYKEWFVRFRFPGYENAEFENGIPKEWEIKKLGSLCKIITGKKDVNEAKGEGKYPFFTCSRETNTFTDEYILDENTILISGNGSYTGFVKKYSGKFDLYQRTYALFGFKKHYWLYLYWVMKIDFEREFMGGSRGSAIPYITRPNIEKFKIIVPDENLLRECQNVFEKTHNLCSLLEKQNKILIKQRDLLLPRLMSGKLEV